MSRKIALIIGNSEYEDKNLARLVTPDADANALAEVLRDPEIGGFDEAIALVNQSSTMIRRAVSSFFTGRGRDDLLLLYFSGHGIRDDRGQLFLAVKDTEHDLLRGTAIPAGFITEEMDNSRSRRQVLILDCCHSGAFSHGMKAAPGTSVGTAAAFEGTGSGRVVLTASDATQYAWEGDQLVGQAENSVFTHYLIKGLRTGEADGDADGRITLDDLYDYVYEQVIHETPKQTPCKWSYGQQGEIVIAKNARPLIKPVELPPDLQQTIDDPRPWVREGAVRELVRLLHGHYPGLALTAHEALKRLADDDSRRVATMAGEALVAYDQAQRVGETSIAEMAPAEGDELAAPRADKEKMERLARDISKAENPPANLTELEARLRMPATIEPKVELGIPNSVATSREISRSLELLITSSTPWKQALMISIGWAIVGLAIHIDVSSNDFGPILLSFAIHGAIGGLATGLALLWTDGFIQWKQMLIVTMGWIIGQAIGWTITFAISFGNIEPIHLAIGFAIGWAIGGLITGLVLQRTHQVIQSKQVLIITIGWAIGLAISWPIAWQIGHGYLGLSWPSKVAMAEGISGAIGGSVMFWQLDQVRSPTEITGWK